MHSGPIPTVTGQSRSINSIQDAMSPCSATGISVHHFGLASPRDRAPVDQCRDISALDCGRLLRGRRIAHGCRAETCLSFRLKQPIQIFTEAMHRLPQSFVFAGASLLLKGRLREQQHSSSQLLFNHFK
jgi:hypothetical protein